MVQTYNVMAQRVLRGMSNINCWFKDSD